MQHTLTVNEMLEDLTRIVEEQAIDDKESAELKDVLSNFDRGLPDNFADKAIEEKMMISRNAHELHFLLSNFALNRDLNPEGKNAIHNLSLWISAYFPFNDFDNTGKMICPYSGKILTEDDYFVASTGYYYSKNNLLLSNNSVEIKNNAKKLMAELDMQALECSYSINYKHRFSYNSEIPEKLFTRTMITMGVIGLIGGMVAGGYLLPIILGGVFTFGAIVWGILLGEVIFGMGSTIIGAGLGLLAAKLYQHITLNSGYKEIAFKERVFPFFTQKNPLIDYTLKTKIKENADKELKMLELDNNLFAKSSSSSKSNQCSNYEQEVESNEFKLYSYLRNRRIAKSKDEPLSSQVSKSIPNQKKRKV